MKGIGRPNNSFKGVKGVDCFRLKQLNNSLGLQRESWVMAYEKDRLGKLRINFNIKHSSVLEGDDIG